MMLVSILPYYALLFSLSSISLAPHFFPRVFLVFFNIFETRSYYVALAVLKHYVNQVDLEPLELCLPLPPMGLMQAPPSLAVFYF